MKLFEQGLGQYWYYCRYCLWIHPVSPFSASFPKLPLASRFYKSQRSCGATILISSYPALHKNWMILSFLFATQWVPQERIRWFELSGSRVWTPIWCSDHSQRVLQSRENISRNVWHIYVCYLACKVFQSLGEHYYWGVSNPRVVTTQLKIYQTYTWYIIPFKFRIGVKPFWVIL